MTAHASTPRPDAAALREHRAELLHHLDDDVILIRGTGAVFLPGLRLIGTAVGARLRETP